MQFSNVEKKYQKYGVESFLSVTHSFTDTVPYRLKEFRNYEITFCEYDFMWKKNVFGKFKNITYRFTGFKRSTVALTILNLQIYKVFGAQHLLDEYFRDVRSLIQERSFREPYFWIKTMSLWTHYDTMKSWMRHERLIYV